MDKISPIKENILNFIDNQRIVKEDFYRKTEISASNLKGPGLKSEIGGDKIAKILSIYPELNSEWLLTGKGKMLKEKELPIAIKSTQNEGIPLLTVKAMAGVFTGDVQVMDYECEKYIIPAFKGADFLIPIKGSSMYPKYSSGDIVACKKLESWSFFQFGKVYVIYTSQGPIIKRILKSNEPDHIKIYSENEARYPEYDLHKEEILGVAIVIGVIRLE